MPERRSAPSAGADDVGGRGLATCADTLEGFSPVQYLEQLSEDFLFAPELAGLELYREVYDLPPGYDPDPPDADTLWTREEERRFAFNLIDRKNFQHIRISRWYDADEDEQRLYPDDPGLETYIFPIHHRFHHPAGRRAAGPMPSRCEGRMQIDLATEERRESRLGPSVAGRTFREPLSELTFTELRGRYAQ